MHVQDVFVLPVVVDREVRYISRHLLFIKRLLCGMGGLFADVTFLAQRKTVYIEPIEAENDWTGNFCGITSGKYYRLVVIHH